MPIMFKNTSGQKLDLYAFNFVTGLPVVIRPSP
jgi:hypothetical protein